MIYCVDMRFATPSVQFLKRLEHDLDDRRLVFCFFFFFFRWRVVLHVGEQDVAVDVVEGVQPEVRPEVGHPVAAELNLAAERWLAAAAHRDHAVGT